MADPKPPPLTPDEADTVEAVAAFHNNHHQATTRGQRVVDAATRSLGRPWVLLALLVLLAVWLGAAIWAGTHAMHGAIVWIEFAGTLSALLVALMILTTQRRETELAERRAQLTLELALLSDRKNAKIIELLEALRRDAPGVAERVDPLADAMAAPADLGAVADAIDGRRGGEDEPSVV